MLKSEYLKQINQKRKKKDDFSFHTIPVLQGITAKEVVDAILMEEEIKSASYEGRLWKLTGK